MVKNRRLNEAIKGKKASFKKWKSCPLGGREHTGKLCVSQANKELEENIKKIY